MLLLYIGFSIYFLVKGTLGLNLDLDNLPKPHAFCSVPLHSGFIFTKFIATFRSVFSRARFYNTCKEFFTVKTAIWMCISIIITIVIKFVFFKYGVNDPLFDYPYLWCSFVTINTLILRFLKILIDTPLDIVEKLSNPITIPNDVTTFNTSRDPGQSPHNKIKFSTAGPSHPKAPLGATPGIGVPGPSHPKAPSGATPGLEVIKPELAPDYVGSKLKRLQTALDSDARAKDKLKWLQKIEDSITDSTESTDKEKLDKWQSYVTSAQAIHKNRNLTDKQKYMAIDALKRGLITSEREPLVNSSTTPDLNEFFKGDTVDRRRSIGGTETITNIFTSPVAKSKKYFINLFKRK